MPYLHLTRLVAAFTVITFLLLQLQIGIDAFSGALPLPTDEPTTLIVFEFEEYTVERTDRIFEVCIVPDTSIPEGVETTIFGFQTVDGTAVDGEDYVGVIGGTDRTFTADTVRHCLIIEILNDSMREDMDLFLMVEFGQNLDNETLVTQVPVFFLANGGCTILSVEFEEYSALEGKSVRVCLVIVEGHISVDKTLCLQGQYDRNENKIGGLPNFNKKLIIDVPPFLKAKDRYYFDINVDDNDLVDMDNSLRLTFSAEEKENIKFVEKEDFAIVKVVDDDILKVGLVEDENDCIVNENAEKVEVCIEILEGELAKPIKLIVNTREDTAKDGQDFKFEPLTKIFHTRQIKGDKVCFDITIVDDLIEEKMPECFTVHVETKDRGVLIARKSKKITIIDDD